MTEKEGADDFTELWERTYGNGFVTGNARSPEIFPVTIKTMLKGMGINLDYVPELPPTDDEP